MKKIFSGFVAGLAAAILLATPDVAFAATDPADMPVVMTLTTNIYGYQGPENNFTIYLGSTVDGAEFYVEGPKSQEYVEVNRYSLGTDTDGDKAVVATAISLSVTETNNKVRIYGDASLIDYIDVHGCYMGALELSPALTNLSVIDLSHNELTAIDLSPYTAINSIDLTDNAFKVPSAMKIGTNHPDLLLLQVGINDVVDPQLDLRNFPNLQYFSGRNNYGITSIDPSGCPDLVSLVLEVTNISSIDVSRNQHLDVLNLSNTKITSVDISRNTNLGEFYLSHQGSYNSDDIYKVTEVDLTHNPYLEYLDLSGNKISSIDLSNNPNLKLLYLQHNQIAEIDLSNNQKLASVNLGYNLLNFATLPLPREGWDYMYYRGPLDCDFKYKVGEPIDFSSEVIRAPYVDEQGNTITPVTYAAVFAVPRAADPYEVDPAWYTFENGVITFNQAIPDSVYVEFYCTAFPDWPLQSGLFKVKTPEDYDKPAVAFTFTPGSSMAGQTVSFKLAGAPMASGLALPADVIISTGGTDYTFEGAVTASSLPADANISFKVPIPVAPVTVYITDGFGATALEMNGIELASIDLNESEALTTLTVAGANLAAIDLGYNRNLRALDLSGNRLTAINLSGVRGDFQKMNLHDVNLSGNRLTAIIIEEPQYFYNLNLANNRISNIDFKYYAGLKSLDLSNNLMSGDLDLTGAANLTSLNVSGNTISSLQLANSRRLTSLNVANNNLSLVTLPTPDAVGADYTYAPQNPYSIIAGGASINLSDQNINGATIYKWMYADTNTAVDPALYTLTDGATRFSESLIGKKVYCEMTNPVFPAFDNAPLTTTVTEVLDRPTNLVASFTTTATGTANIGFRFAGNGANAVYIDWNGDGSQYDEYLYDQNNTETYRTGRSVAGKTAKVYTYGDPADVTMMFLLNVPLRDLDATPMTRAEAFDIHGAGLTDGNIKLPTTSTLYELVLDGSNLREQSFANLSGLRFLNLGGNNYTTFDASAYPNLTTLIISENNLTSLKFGNNSRLTQLNATQNRLSTIDLTGLSGLRELVLVDNNFETLDVSPVANHLAVLSVEGNYLTFATLPRYEQFNPTVFNTYYYANQNPLVASCAEGRVDLSTEASVNGVETVYRWFLGDKQSDVYYDYYYEMFIGEELEGPDVSADPEYTVKNGVTIFNYVPKRKVICAMTNEAFPNLILYTTPISVDVAGVENVAVDAQESTVDVYTITGIKVAERVDRATATAGLAPGLYIVGNQKVMVK
ncbi:MAG: leucine-rich repeat domain-containing protein [Muribaculaceae bacterium]|nr:leucine-rich repeat domain-containing protein [Muribaculaceae bacterium]